MHFLIPIKFHLSVNFWIKTLWPWLIRSVHYSFAFASYNNCWTRHSQLSIWISSSTCFLAEHETPVVTNPCLFARKQIKQLYLIIVRIVFMHTDDCLHDNFILHLDVPHAFVRYPKRFLSSHRSLHSMVAFTAFSRLSSSIPLVAIISSRRLLHTDDRLHENLFYLF